MYILETKTYKFLNIIINIRLKDTDRIHVHLAEEANNLKLYIRYTLANIIDVNHITLLDTLWQQVIVSVLTHGSGIWPWFNDTGKAKQSLQSFLYKCGGGVLQIHCMLAKIATLGDLGLSLVY